MTPYSPGDRIAGPIRRIWGIAQQVPQESSHDREGQG